MNTCCFKVIGNMFLNHKYEYKCTYTQLVLVLLVFSLFTFSRSDTKEDLTVLTPLWHDADTVYRMVLMW